MKLVCGAGRVVGGLVAWLMLLGAPPLAAKALEYDVAPPPAWVVPIAPAHASRKPLSAVGGVDALLIDRQTRIDAGGKTSFVHVATKPVDSSGVDSAGNISIQFEPGYQKLTLHAIKLIRDGREINKLDSARIDVLQRETELEYRIYDGRKTVNVELDDLRVGDVVEYAYSIRGLNPVFRNRVSGDAQLQFNVPLDRIFVRLLTPIDRPMNFRNYNTRLQPQLREADGYRDYRWDLVSMPGARAENDAPAGFDPHASVAWTEFEDWASVVQWALPLYRHAAPGPAVSAEVARIAAASKSPADRVRAVLRLVQRDIRYLGVEIGASTHAPAAPDLVFKRRFGDCKDKATLMVAMLAALGIDAFPALVHTDRLDDKTAPTPHAFNHVIVRVRVDDTTYWLDPTRAEQQGDLANLHEPDYGVALVLDPASRALTPMQREARYLRTVRSVFDSSAGFERPVSYTIATTVQGKEADRMRAHLASTGAAALALDYLNYYARTYPEIKAALPLAVKDDLETNTLTLSESYTIANFWQRQEKRNRYMAEIRSAEIRSRLSTPQALNRLAPLALVFPEEVDEVTTVKLPEAWDTLPESMSVTDAAFKFTHVREVSADGMTIVLKDRYRALADRVLPGAMAAYAEHLRKADEDVGMTLTLTDEPQQAPLKAHIEWRAVLTMVLFFAMVIFSLLMHTSPEGHRATDLRLLIGFGLLAGALVLATTLVRKDGHIVLAVLATLYALHLMLRKISRMAPASHWLYPMAHPDAARIHPPLFTVFTRTLRAMPALLVIACALMLAFVF